MLRRDLVQDTLGFLRPQNLLRILCGHLTQNIRILDFVIDSQRALFVLVILAFALRAGLHRRGHLEHGIEAGLHAAERGLRIKLFLQLLVALI